MGKARSSAKMERQSQERARAYLRLIMQVQAGETTVIDAARQLGVSRQVFHEHCNRMLAASLEALDGGRGGRPPQSPEQLRIRELEQQLADQTQELAKLKILYDLRGEVLTLFRDGGSSTGTNEKKTQPGPEPAQKQTASVMELVLQARTMHAGIRLGDLLRAVLSSRSRFFRLAARQELGLPLLFPRGRKPVILPQDQEIMDELRKLVKGNHRRLKGRGAFATEHPDIPDRSMRRLIGLLKEEMRIKRRDTLLEVLYQEPGMIWSMDIFERRFAGRKEYVLQVIDLGSRFKLAPAIQNRDFTAWEVAEHLNKLFLMYGAPLFLKRDNGGNLKGEPVEKLLNLFCAIPQNSPPYTPPYNGVVERMQGEVKADLDRLLAGGDICQCIFTGAVMNAVFIANARPREALQGKTANDRFVPPMGKYSKEERQAINDWICRRARDIAGNAGPFFHGTEKEKLPDSAWRLAIREWQENHGFIAFQKKGKIIRLSMKPEEIQTGTEDVCRTSFTLMQNR